MQKPLLYKFLAVGGLAILLLVPLSMISGVIHERQSYRDVVINNIAQSSTGTQQITGAMLVTPYTKNIIREVDIYEEGKKQTVEKRETLQQHAYWLPETLEISGNIVTEERYRGIYKVPVYTADLSLKGHFSVPKQLGLTSDMKQITIGKPYIVLGIKDIRGINRSVRLNVNDIQKALVPGTKTEIVPEGIHAELDVSFESDQTLTFDVDMELQGMKNLRFLPTGKFTKVDLSSPWPHPSFTGRFLPKTRDVNDEGFKATWETSFFASNMLEHLNACTHKNHCRQFHANSFGVSLHEGVDIYQQAQRSVKYALLFVGLTFVAFFLFEVLKGSPIHAVQYGLVGIVLALFYLLLVSLSEHIAFALSYAIASIACVSLLTFYVSFVLRSISRGAIFGATLVGLYGALYVLIQSEDTALLMGAGLLFGVLSFVMIITRDVDWYKIEANTKHQLGAASPAQEIGRKID